MGCTRKQFVAQMQEWVGLKESDNSHRKIIDIYNTIRPLPRSYKLTYWDAWCAGTVSAAAKACNALDIIPAECSCPYMTSHAQNMGIWVEDDAYVPAPGDIIMYDFQDSGAGDNRGGIDHVGVVEKVTGNDMVIIEGNYSDSVKRRDLKVNGRYIRGYIVPKFDADSTINNEPVVETKPVAPTVEAYKPTVMEWQKAAIADGFKFPVYGADGYWGNECISVAKKAIVKKRSTYTNKNLTKIVQKVVGVTVDGLCGNDTRAAIINYQKNHGLEADGEVGLNTWKKMLGVN